MASMVKQRTNEMKVRLTLDEAVMLEVLLHDDVEYGELSLRNMEFAGPNEFTHSELETIRRAIKKGVRQAYQNFQFDLVDPDERFEQDNFLYGVISLMNNEDIWG
jgi:hypothetical protein